MNGPEANPNMEKKCPQCGASLPSGALEGLCPACLLKQGSETAGQAEPTPFRPPSIEEMARLFPQLEILTLIGKGGMGAVYKARQPALDRYVALKILPPQIASGPGFADRFNREARALARLSHPNIVAVHEFGQANGLPYLIMEFVDGLNLRQLERAGKLSPREALQIVPQICEALQFAHDEGIVHRDIKPENILLDEKGRVKIADFGIAKIIGREAELGLTETGRTIGTPQYMAPEQAEKPETVDHRADIFSLGVVFYEMLTGELPLGKFAPPSGKVKVDVRLDEVVLRALEKEPERRYQRASQVKTAVDSIASTGTAMTPAESEAMAAEILARDYVLDIGSCLRRGWALVVSDFWPIVGITALMILLVQAACSTAIGIVAGGPLMGGLWLYLLKRARGEPASVETAFSGFHIAFANLFLAGLVTWMLIILGFICFIIPGLYLAVAWMFTLVLVIDKRLDFWTAMELSRKMVTKHWWKFFGFWFVLLLMKVGGALFCGIGIFLAAPIALAAAVFAYEDIFGVAAQKANLQAGARVGPSGTVVMPVQSGAVRSGGGFWKVAAVGVAGLVFFLGFIAMVNIVRGRARHRAAVIMYEDALARPEAALPVSTPFNYGPVVERVLELSNPDRRALNLASGNFVASTPDHPAQFRAGWSQFLARSGCGFVPERCHHRSSHQQTIRRGCAGRRSRLAWPGRPGR
jgi:predicted Ser/Thr protein kinase